MDRSSIRYPYMVHCLLVQLITPRSDANEYAVLGGSFFSKSWKRAIHQVVQEFEVLKFFIYSVYGHKIYIFTSNECGKYRILQVYCTKGQVSKGTNMLLAMKAKLTYLFWRDRSVSIQKNHTFSMNFPLGHVTHIHFQQRKLDFMHHILKCVRVQITMNVYTA